jgi:hypothetical protein
VLPPTCHIFGEAIWSRKAAVGVDVCLGKPVQAIDEDGVVIGDERIQAKTVVRTAGVAPSPAGKWLGCGGERASRVRIQPDLTVPDHPEVFVVGDTASLDQDGRPLPGVAQVAMQQGKHAALSIFRKVSGHPPSPPFRYFDKGNLAVVGKNFAVLQSTGIQFSGFMAWLVWSLVHISIPGGEQLEVQRLPAMGMDLSERQARCSAGHPQQSGSWVKSKGLLYDNREGKCTARAKSMGGRVGTAKSDDGQINLKLDRPVEMGGKGNGTRIPENVAIDSAVSLAL